MDYTVGVFAPSFLRGWPIVLLVGLALGCQTDDDEPRPPGYDGDTGSGFGSGFGSGDGDGMGGEGPAEGDSVSGTVSEYLDDTFTNTAVYEESATAYVISQNGQSHRSGATSGGTFTVSGIEHGPDRWVAVEADDDDALVPTVTRQDLGDAPLVLPLVPRTVLEGIVFSLQSQVNINENAAHIALTIVDDTGAPIPGVEVTYNSGGGTVAYKNGDTWLDLDDSSNASGQIFIANEQAANLPGTDSQLILTGSIDEELLVRVINGSVTVMTVVLGP